MLFRHRKPINLRERIRLLVWPRRSFARSFHYMCKRILRISATPHKIALGFSIGIFSACSPFFGLHIILAVFFSWILRGNFTAAIIGTIFSNPLTFFPIIVVDYKVGYLFLSLLKHVDKISLVQIRTMFDGLTFSQIWLIFWETWDLVMMPMILGGMFLGSILGGLFYIGVYSGTVRFQKKRYKKIMKKVNLHQENQKSIS
ncbi:DUF2062 domain-containing protein [Bartonella bacilliformis]|uniref:DUF2062 domain-containing protein n=1 Tax=Bartonella bacilliformis Ver097 TaxID=1293911 RepID=A0A072R2H9_BARBA|nr:DUF2062 domain-containing protein [Bartonella bacilliformis]KEG19980.1 hypothetical protein H710_00576 [Bartonella bacilliformis Ver097]